MKSISYILSLLTIIITLILIETISAPLFSISQNPIYASTLQQEESSSDGSDDSSGENDETQTVQENVNLKQSNNGVNNTNTAESPDQNQGQQPPQIDTISPKVLSVTPNIGTSGIPVTTTITTTFSEPVDASTVTNTTFTLETDNNKVQGSTSLNSDATTAIFTPSSALSGSTIYTATISEVKDLAGNTMNFASPWSFTTEAQAAPPSQTPPQQPSPSNPSTPSNPSGGAGNTGGGSSGGVLGDIKTSPTEKDVLKDAAQYVEDEKLVDRILPIILSKMDKRQLVATVLPYVDLQVSVRQVEGETTRAQGSENRQIKVSATCSTDEFLIGGSFGVPGGAKVTGTSMEGNKWSVYSTHNPYYDANGNDYSSTESKAICIKAELVPKDPNAPTVTGGGSEGPQ